MEKCLGNILPWILINIMMGFTVFNRSFAVKAFDTEGNNILWVPLQLWSDGRENNEF